MINCLGGSEMGSEDLLHNSESCRLVLWWSLSIKLPRAYSHLLGHLYEYYTHFLKILLAFSLNILISKESSKNQVQKTFRWSRKRGFWIFWT
jgi:hypothetical protein